MFKRKCFLVIFILLVSVSAIAQPKPRIDRSKQDKPKTETKSSTPSKNVTPQKNSSTVRPEQTYNIAIIPDSADFDEDGGRLSFVVSSDKDWYIDTKAMSWWHLDGNGDTLILSVDANSGDERSSFFVISSGDRRITVPFTQRRRDYLNVSDEDLYFPANGGERLIRVEASQGWTIGSYPEMWGYLQINGDNITFKVDPNKRPYRRTDYFTILSGNNWKKIHITQDGMEYYVKVDGTIYPTTVTFNPSGGTKYYSVSTNAEDYTISGLPDWCRVESKTQHGFILSCSKNKTAHQRDGCFYVEAAGNSVKVNINQPPKYKTKSAERFPPQSEWHNILGFNMGVIGHYHSTAAVWQGTVNLFKGNGLHFDTDGLFAWDIRYIGGGLFNKSFFIGIGTGLVKYKTISLSSYSFEYKKDIIFPLYLHLKWYMLGNSLCSPYIATSQGVDLYTSKCSIVGGNAKYFFVGPHARFELGVHFKPSKKRKFGITLGCEFGFNPYNYISYISSWDGLYNYRVEFEPHYFSHTSFIGGTFAISF
jgi:hypothetical protein